MSINRGSLKERKSTKGNNFTDDDSTSKLLGNHVSQGPT